MSFPFIDFYEAVKPAEMAEDNNPEPRNRARLARELKAKLKLQYREALRKREMNIRRHNDAVKAEAKRGVRRPGRDHSGLFQALDQLLGSVATKVEVVRDVIEEALRFRRRALAQLLEDHIVEMELNANPNRQDQICRQCAARRAANNRQNCACKSRSFA